MNPETPLLICSRQPLTLADLSSLIENPDRKIGITAEAEQAVERCHRYILGKLEGGEVTMYGINTGFGFLANKKVSKSELGQLQLNLIRSHACGAGREVRSEIVRLMLALKVKGLALGHSGVSVETVKRIADFYNAGVVPVVYEQGSLGASGDLAPLAHLFLPLIGEGEVYYENKKISSAELHQRLGWKPVTLGPKEGLALLNGTQFMLAHGIWLWHQSRKISVAADTIAALSLEGFNGRADAFHPLIHEVRAHRGQVECAARILELLGGPDAMKRSRKQVQDPYAFRCVPQVHGASADVLTGCGKTFEKEANSVSDNPLIFPEQDLVVSGGNFHGQPLALALERLTLALAELGSISERRTYQLMSGVNDLPLFLCKNPGLSSGMMITQYTAAAVASQNKQLCTPAAADSIPSSNGQEDHVSMGANSATKAVLVYDNLLTILGIEMMNASQALWLRNPADISPGLHHLVSEFRKSVPPVEEDRIFSGDIANAAGFVKAMG